MMVVVLGMHRSGTSCVTGMLTKLGLNAGDYLLPAAQDNPNGFFEDERIVLFQHKILSCLGNSWDSPKPVDESWTDSGLFNYAVSTIKDLVVGLDVIKDPRSCKLIPMWKKLNPKFLVVRRNKDAVCSSLLKRNGMNYQLSSELYDHYNREIDRNLKNYCLVQYEDVLKDWKKEFSRVTKELDLNLDLNVCVDGFLDKSLDHSERN